MKNTRIILLALALLATTLSAPAIAAAQTEVVPTRIDVQLWPESEQGFSTIIVSATVPESATLPATVRMPLPRDAEVSWVGEILGADPANDIARQLTTVTADGGLAIVVTAEKSRDIQYEAIWKQTQVDGDGRSDTLQWLQTVSAGGVVFRAKIPAGAGDVRIVPAPTGKPATNRAGEKLYTVPPLQLRVGESFTLSVRYRVGAAGERAGGRPGDLVLPVLVGLLVVAAAALAWVLLRQRAALRGSGSASPDEAVAGPEDEDPFGGV